MHKLPVIHPDTVEPQNNVIIKAVDAKTEQKVKLEAKMEIDDFFGSVLKKCDV